GSDGVINPLQIFRTEDNSNPEKNEEISFMQHISKVATFYMFLAGKPSSEEIEEFKKVLRLFYDSLGFTDIIHTTGITSLANEYYSIFSYFLMFNRDQLYNYSEKCIIHSRLSSTRIKLLEKIEFVIDNLVYTFSYLFNGHTTMTDI